MIEIQVQLICAEIINVVDLQNVTIFSWNRDPVCDALFVLRHDALRPYRMPSSFTICQLFFIKIILQQLHETIMTNDGDPITFIFYSAQHISQIVRIRQYKL